LRARLDVKDVDPETRQSLIGALGGMARGLGAPAAAEAAKDLRARLDGKDIDPETRRSLIRALANAASRLDATTAAEVARDLRARLDGKDIDPETRRSLIRALVAGRFDATTAAEVAKDLRARLKREDADLDTRISLIDAAAELVVISTPHPTTEEIATMRLAMSSIAWPLRDPDRSPAWARLESISGEKFDRDVRHLLDWLQRCCNLSPSAARPPFD
jgi:truncated hemoglobin YjbI